MTTLPVPSADPVVGRRGRHVLVASAALLFFALSVLLGALAGVAAAAQRQTEPIEDYASYEPQTRCSPAPKAGTKLMAAWLVDTWPGTSAPLARRSCSSGGVSEHKEGRAIDWTLDAAKKADRRKARQLLAQLFATDADGNTHALARRMGVMYVIWNDHIYSSYRQFEARDYLSSSCRTKASCSKTLRHRDHVHISLSRAGGRGATSWYAAQS